MINSISIKQFVIIAIFVLISLSSVFAMEAPIPPIDGRPDRVIKLDPKEMTQPGIASIIAAAKQDFLASPNSVVVIQFPKGSFDLSGAFGTGLKSGVIDVSNVQPGPKGWLVFIGAGKYETTLIMPTHNNINWILGINAHHIMFRNMNMISNDYTVSQGHVVEAGLNYVVLDIQPGFPTPAQLDLSATKKGYLRQYTDSQTDPQIVESSTQIHWRDYRQLSGSQWLFYIKRQTTAPYQAGDLIGIKTKEQDGGDAYWFFASSDIIFRNFMWRGMTVGEFRGGTNKVAILDSVIERMPPVNGQTPCMSSPGGGPQIGNVHDPVSTGNLVQNNNFTATGDDSIAFHNAQGAIIGNFVTDSFARGILLENSPTDVTIENNMLTRCPFVDEIDPPASGNDDNDDD